MQTSRSYASSSTLQEWSTFLTVLNKNKYSDKPLLKKAESPHRIVMHLEKELSEVKHETIFRRLGRHRQLSLNFS